MIRLTDEQKLDWLRLIRSENVGPTTFRALINQFGSASKALEQIPELSKRGGAKRQIKLFSKDKAEREIQYAQKLGVELVAMGEHKYPKSLSFIDGSPPLLYIKGQSNVTNLPAIAIVGSRNCSAAGAKLSSKIAFDLGNAGIIVVAGMARGIDTAAHKASLDTGTIAVLAGGIDNIYPSENNHLYREIQDNGAVISEMPMGYRATGRDFPKRNRIISGVSLGTLVIEAAQRSGSLITARLANEQGREVFAIPGSPLDPRAEGTNYLIKQGATLATNADDILQALTSIIENPDLLKGVGNEPELDIGVKEVDVEELIGFERERIISAISSTPIEVDEIVRFTQLPIEQILTVILELELAGKLSRHPGQRVSLI